MKPIDFMGQTVKVVRWSVIGGLLMTLLVLWAFREKEHPALEIIKDRRARKERDLICQQDVALARTADDSAKAFAGRGPLNGNRLNLNGVPTGQCVIEGGQVRWVK